MDAEVHIGSGREGLWGYLQVISVATDSGLYDVLFGEKRQGGRIVSRAPFQVLVLPFRRTVDGTFEHAVFRRKDEYYWQHVAGGGEEGETAIEAARRETREEAGLTGTKNFFSLKTVSSIPVYHFADREHWGKSQYVVPGYYFARKVSSGSIELSAEHDEFKWVDFETAKYLLYWDHDKTALWELNERLLNDDMIPA